MTSPHSLEVGQRAAWRDQGPQFAFLKCPVLTVRNGTDDEMAQPVVRSTVEMASFNTNGVTIPVVFGAQDDQDGKTINVEGFADVLAHKPGLAAITIQGYDHRPSIELERPDGKTFTFDARAMMMRFFLELEKQS